MLRGRGGEETGCCKKLGLIIEEEEEGEERSCYQDILRNTRSERVGWDET